MKEGGRENIHIVHNFKNSEIHALCISHSIAPKIQM